jgi:hypothetical protein
MQRHILDLAGACGAAGIALLWLTGCASQTAFRTIATPQVAPDSAALTLYVSPLGNDGWSGAYAVPNAEGTDGPLASIQEARDRIRALKAAAGGLSRPVTVLLMGGVYRQKETLEFTPEDSGTAACPITYQAYPGQVPVVSGGDVITGWERDDSAHSKERCRGKLWRTTVPRQESGKTWIFNQLFVDGERRVRARLPNKGEFFRTDGPVSKNNPRAFYFAEGDLKQWDNLRHAIAVVYHSWETSIHHFRTVEPDTRKATFREPAPWPMGRWEKRQRYYVENVFEGLDEPGEWYLDWTSGVLYYYPMPGEDMDDVEVIAPRVTSTLVAFNGDPVDGGFIEYINFRGISFQHTDANLRRLRNPGQGEIYQPALIMANGLRNAEFEACEVAHTGAHAIWLAAGCTDDVVQTCHLHDLGGGGVYIGGGWGIHERAPAGRITVDNNFIHDGGKLFHGAHGVWIGRSSYNQITHNEISNFDYSGISCGWSWGFQPSTANHNNLDYNHIHHLSNGEGLSDMGGIYTLGVSPGTTERYNHIHDVYSYKYVSHGSGVYPDEGSTGILIENNVVHRVRTCPLFMHYGKECIVHNNILAFGGKGQLRRSREDKRCHYVATNNIVYGDITKMLDGPWKNEDWTLESNLYWSTAGEPVFNGMSFADWQAKGYDKGSIVADPEFKDAEDGDFRIPDDSPALSIGFKPIDLSNTGLYGAPSWVSLPSKYPNRPLNEIAPPVEPPFVINFSFEADEPGGEPLEGRVVKGSNGAAIAVSSDAAAEGANSLKFTDAPGQQYDWTPHIYYNKTYETGKVHLSWDMLNSQEAPASFYVEVRQWNVSPYLVGPTVSVDTDGTVTASKRKIGTIPLGKWAHVTIEIELGEQAPKSYKLALSVPGSSLIKATVPYMDKEFDTVTWLGISSTSTESSVFYIDNLKLGTEDELAVPPARRPGGDVQAARRAANEKEREPANDQMLMGYWTFDDLNGYTAEDSSGYGNHGDVWAAWAKGPFGSAIYCDPASPQVVIPDDPTLRFGTSDFTVEMWICPTQLSIDDKDPRRRFLSKNNYPRTWMVMDITPQGRPSLEMVDAEKNQFSPKPERTIPENSWTHLAVVVDRSNGEARYYFNGKLDSTVPIPDSFTGPLDVTDGDLSIGSSWHPFIGLIDEVKIYKRALPPAEIKAEYDRQKAMRKSAEYELIE